MFNLFREKHYRVTMISNDTKVVETLVYDKQGFKNFRMYNDGYGYYTILKVKIV